MSLNLKSFEACIEKIAAGMALDEAVELIARGDAGEGAQGQEPIASIAQEDGIHGQADAGEHGGEAGAVDPDIALAERRLLASGPITPEDQEELASAELRLAR